MVFNYAVSINSDDKRQWASNDSLLSVLTLNHYTGNLLKGVPQEFSLPGLSRFTSLRNLIPIVTLVTKHLSSLPGLPTVPINMITKYFSRPLKFLSWEVGTAGASW